MSKQSDRRRRVVRATAPAAGLLAAGLLVWQGSYAAFSATTVDTNNAWSSGSLALTNNGGGPGYSAATSATFGGSNLTPGTSGTTCLTVKSIGTAAGSLAMYESSLVDSSPSLGAHIQLTITAATVATDVQANCTGFPTSGTITTIATAQPTCRPRDRRTATPITSSSGIGAGPVAILSTGNRTRSSLAR